MSVRSISGKRTLDLLAFILCVITTRAYSVLPLPLRFHPNVSLYEPKVEAMSVVLLQSKSFKWLKGHHTYTIEPSSAYHSHTILFKYLAKVLYLTTSYSLVLSLVSARVGKRGSQLKSE